MLALVLTGAVLSGCGLNDRPSTAADAGAATKPSSAAVTPGSEPAAGAAMATPDPLDVAYENEIAHCMTRHGFRYIPHPVVTDSAPDSAVNRYRGLASLLQPDDVVRTWRQKYGRGEWSAIVYPDDPAFRAVAPTDDPNKAVVEALDPTRRSAYNVAMWGSADATGEDPKSARGGAYLRKHAVDQSCAAMAGDHRASRAAQRNRRSAVEKRAAAELRQMFTNDPVVISSAKSYDDCLQDRGYTMHSKGQPGAVSRGGEPPFEYHSPEGGESLSTARHELLAEIKIAVDDVDCRIPYASIIRRKYAKVVTDQLAGLS